MTNEEKKIKKTYLSKVRKHKHVVLMPPRGRDAIASRMAIDGLVDNMIVLRNEMIRLSIENDFLKKQNRMLSRKISSLI